MRTLSVPHREVLALYYLADLPVGEVAHALGIAENTVKSRLKRARDILRKALAEEPSDDGGGEGVAHTKRGIDPNGTSTTHIAQFICAMKALTFPLEAR